MFSSDSIEEIVKHIKNLVDSNRCGVCDKIDGIRLRYACGHTSCEDCTAASVDCSLCLTPQSAFQEPVIDRPLTERIKNAVRLLNVFQDEYHIDVYKRQRLSEQLKIEKEIFPECIQAPIKYFNKRKSLKNSKHNKENTLIQLPGEAVPSWDHKMDKTNVEQWLNKYVRKPFTELNSNDNKLRNSKINNYHVAIDSENKPILHRKRPYSQTASKNPSKTKTKSKSMNNKKTKIEQDVMMVTPYIEKNINLKNKSIFDKENDESGIVLDEEEAVIVIDDSQSGKVDKDLSALKAVHEADNNKKSENSFSESRELLPQVDLQNMKKTFKYKVPFYLRSTLSSHITHNDTAESPFGNKDISITIDNKSFTTIINVKRVDVVETCKQSVEVQTELIDDEENFNNKGFNRVTSPESFMVKNNSEIDNNVVNQVNKRVNKIQNVVIEESESDEDLDASISMTVTAEVHRSCEEIDYGILGGVDNLEEHSKRARRAARGHTPASTDSSEKENFNPNRQKKTPNSKKKSEKK